MSDNPNKLDYGHFTPRIVFGTRQYEVWDNLKNWPVCSADGKKRLRFPSYGKAIAQCWRSARAYEREQAEKKESETAEGQTSDA